MDDKQREEQDKKVINQNNKMIEIFESNKAKRHVKEPTEEVFKEILSQFSLNYGRLMVVPTNEEILKLLEYEI